jgi:hypothetical protein
MPTKEESWHKSPEFDDVGPITVVDRVLLWTVWPFVVLHRLFVQPFQFRRSIVLSRTVQLRPLTDEENAKLSPVAANYLDSLESRAHRVGFAEAVRYGDSSGRTHTIKSLIPNASGVDLCDIGIAHVPRRLTITSLLFYTRLSDGFTIVTGNDDTRLSRPTPNVDMMDFPGVDDVAALYDIHRRRRERAITPDRIPIAVGWHAPAMHPLELLQRGLDEAIDLSLAHGIVQPKDHLEMRYTLKGATMAAWRLQWPWPRIVAWRQRRRAAKALRELAS